MMPGSRQVRSFRKTKTASSTRSPLLSDPPTHVGPRGPQRTNTAPATEAVKQYAAERAIDDPVKLAQAARIIRTALARQRLTIDELTSDTSEVA
jgi:hypothetical protein